MYTYSQHRFLESRRVFGLKLRPFTLGHADVLTGLAHPAFGGKSNGAAEDMAVLVFVCSRQWKVAEKQIRNGRALTVLAKIGKRFRKSSVEDVKAAKDLVTEYIDVYSMAPPRWEKGDEPQSIKAPWPLAVFAILQEKTNYTAKETWGLPVATAMELVAVIGSNNGDDSLVSGVEMAVYNKMMESEK